MARCVSCLWILKSISHVPWSQCVWNWQTGQNQKILRAKNQKILHVVAHTSFCCATILVCLTHQRIIWMLMMYLAVKCLNLKKHLWHLAQQTKPWPLKKRWFAQPAVFVWYFHFLVLKKVVIHHSNTMLLFWWHVAGAFPWGSSASSAIKRCNTEKWAWSSMSTQSTCHASNLSTGCTF